MREKFTFDDVALQPEYSDIERGDIDISSELFGYRMEVPIISSPMDTITGVEMMKAMRIATGFKAKEYLFRGLGIHHRYCSLDELRGATDFGGIAVSPSMTLTSIEGLFTHWNPNPLFCLDVAHGFTKRNLDFAAELVKMGASVISGNIVTPAAAEAYMKIGVKALRIGIGAGSACTTRVVTGVGIPQLSAIADIFVETNGTDVILISDGGHRTTGDIVKSLAFGADFVMLGGMLAGTDEAEGGNHFRGMASASALSERKAEFFVEGVEKEVQPKGSVSEILKNIKDAIETACYYVGARNLQELKQANFVFVTNNGMIEGHPR